MASDRQVGVPIIRVKDLRPGDEFETMLSAVAGIVRDRYIGAGGAVPVELWYPGGSKVVSLHPHVRVRLLGRGVA